MLGEQNNKSELKRLNRALKTVSACNHAMVRAVDERHLLREICRIIVDAGGYCQARVGLLDEGSESEGRSLDWTGYHDGQLMEASMMAAEILGDRDLASQALDCQESIIEKAVSLDAREKPCCQQALKRGSVSIIALPLCYDGKTLGTLNIRTVEPEIFDSEEIDLLTELAEDLAFGITSMRVRVAHRQAATDLRQSLDRLGATMKKTIMAMAKMTEIRDPYTAGHQQRVASLSHAIAGEMKLPEAVADYIYLAASVHDIGKIHVPSEILTTPGRISEIEFELIKTHPLTGYEILGTVDFPWPLPDVVLQHHEKMDGSGYPAGLKGDEIILEARIVCVADVVEAMSSHRPYRPLLGLDSALEEVTSQRGIAYDTDVVDACVRLFADMKFKFDEYDYPRH